MLISCKKKINSFIAERFATFLFKQIGQPGSYRNAYDNAKVLTLTANKEIRFKEFDTMESIQEAGDDFDFGYIEIKPAAAAPAPPQAQKAKSSIIGQNTLIRDALTANYVHEIIESLASNASEIDNGKLQLLKLALLTAEQIAKGEKKDKQATEIFQQAAEAFPGLNSGKVFDSLINAEKHIDDNAVKNLLKAKDSSITIDHMLQHVNSITA